MKKFIFIIVSLIIGINTQAQNNLIIQQSSGATTTETSSDNSTYQINGISAKEDVGGVEYNVVDEYSCEKTYGYSTYKYYKTYLILTNYHNCTVSVLIDYEWNDSNRSHELSDGVKSFVLRANETKRILVRDGEWKASSCVNIIGMIVRKL